MRRDFFFPHIFIYICRDSTDTHYDPSREDHAKFEQEIKSSEGSKESKENNISDDTLSADKHERATQEKFYSVSDSLKGFFANKDQVLYVSSSP